MAYGWGTRLACGHTRQPKAPPLAREGPGVEVAPLFSVSHPGASSAGVLSLILSALEYAIQLKWHHLVVTGLV